VTEPPAQPEQTLAAGPLLLFGLALAILGLLRRRPVLVLGGAAAMWVDRDSVLSGLRSDSAPPVGPS
jgi:hypothetical protein